MVSHRWLEECLRQWRRLPEWPFAARCGREEDEIAAEEVPDSEADEALDDDGQLHLANNGNGGDGEDRVFIDRSPTLFNHVLAWLRTGSVAGVPDTPSARRALLQEADFFGLPGLIDALKGYG